MANTLTNISLVTDNNLQLVDIEIDDDNIITSIEPSLVLRQVQDDIARDDTVTSPQPEAPKQHLLLFPGLIDCHVHFRDPGTGDSETMESGARAALAGGMTTVCDMPNTSPPTCTMEALEMKKNIRDRLSVVSNKKFDIRFFFGVTELSHLDELARVDRQDIVGVKLYFDHSTGNQMASHDVIEKAFAFCAEQDLPVVCHCEDSAMNEQALANVDQTDIRSHSKARPPESEAKAIADAIALSKKYGTQLHIAHISTSSGCDLVRQAKNDGLNVTCEVTPHHLFLTDADYETLGTLGKMNPPLRSQEDVDALWAAIADKTIDCVATDHAPHTLESKMVHTSSADRPCHTERNEAQPSEDEVRPVDPPLSMTPLDAPSGVPGTETMLPLLLSCMHGGPVKPSLAPARDDTVNTANPNTSTNLTPQDILRLCFTNPNRIFHLDKPGITVGKPADFALVDPTACHVIHAQSLQSKCGWTPYEGWECMGRVCACHPE